MLKRYHSDVYASIALQCLAVLMFVASLRMETLTILSIGVGSRFLPMLMAAGIFLLSTVLLLSGLKKQTEPVRETASAVDAPDVDNNQPQQKTSDEKTTVLATSLLLIGYVVALPVLGFILASTLYMAGQSMMMTSQHKKRFFMFVLPISFAVSLLLYYVFRVGFNLMLPIGLFG
ncbi:tripartite tricarboxylate transporter TctB family protein [Shouchella clausii]|uniref:tripartite tricarboxylate transporter TctB family protein n=1 Tax=Shouchella TaxID=2893057 RepID=UPI0004E7572C|nr:MULTISPECIES: tripartite tricarboxylate transporter TctB family protein [Shouchella]ALA52401.1 Tricarboxylate transport protein TctB [Shouchella clausii]MBU3230173.1 tripartite tricarboxylate transporter TctB family protein [Shouchella clausii]MBU3262628.1 tripartite tricarboxylate transporter TctB family protein [Shouchella clausii]MBU3507057.1 tripartite tricarboxylate transporter TctB family protein [Shouchella clausii]MBU3536682.1 tripartite tricarboxylate transporter TctB family protei